MALARSARPAGHESARRPRLLPAGPRPTRRWLALVLTLTSCIHQVRSPPRSPLPRGTVAVVGAVPAPGLYDHRAGLTLLGALRLAGGLAIDAAPACASITRFAAGLAASAGIRLDLIASGEAPDLPLEEGDVLSVPPGPCPAR